MSKKVTPAVIANTMKENFTNRGRLASLYASQLFSKFSPEQLEGLKENIDQELESREKQVVHEHIDWLKEHGFKVSKK
ncbi:MAG: hypothetical protein RLP14_02690 [Owenweeksia sp.]